MVCIVIKRLVKVTRGAITDVCVGKPERQGCVLIVLKNTLQGHSLVVHACATQSGGAHAAIII